MGKICVIRKKVICKKNPGGRWFCPIKNTTIFFFPKKNKNRPERISFLKLVHHWSIISRSYSKYVLKYENFTTTFQRKFPGTSWEVVTLTEQTEYKYEAKIFMKALNVLVFFRNLLQTRGGIKSQFKIIERIIFVCAKDTCWSWQTAQGEKVLLVQRLV